MPAPGQTSEFCKRGHPLAGANVYARPNKPRHRECRTCRAESSAKRNKGTDPRATEARFFEKVAIVGDCWEFKDLRPDGYGRFWFEGRNMPAHRWCYEFLICEVPAALHLDHLCRNRACVNPDHLEPVTPRINTLRGATLPAENILKTHCVRGHLLAGDNLRRDKRGVRRCRACHRINAAASRKRVA